MSFWFHRLDQNATKILDKFCPTHSRAEFAKYFGGILAQMMTPKGRFEINWPLEKSLKIIWNIRKNTKNEIRKNTY